ncbi:hypothetical protein BOQ64_16665 [Chryseobacterium sp. CH25]|nr:hypothetical protein BOQ64_16665 [Chryseobacterium sp. CH25]RXM62718.1 hypothetical protein BOQ60_19955 [Chryseobacterium sp. CH1]
MRFLINIPFILIKNEKTKSLQIVNFLMRDHDKVTCKIIFSPRMHEYYNEYKAFKNDVSMWLKALCN